MDIQPKKQPRRPSLTISKKLILFYVSLGALIFAAAIVRAEIMQDWDMDMFFSLSTPLTSLKL